MLTLYTKTGCPYCAVVLKKIADLELSIEEKNIADQANADELTAKGGKRQVPYLVDDEHGVSMYESADIAAYLEKTYGSGDAPALRIHRSKGSDTCKVTE